MSEVRRKVTDEKRHQARDGAPARYQRPSVPGRAIFVVGPGRSGTSAITRGLQALGVELGDRLKAPTSKNPTGFFEDRDLLRISKRVRAVLGLRAESVALVRPEQWKSPQLEALRREAQATIAGRFAGAPVWGFKYAQTLRLLPFWQPLFESGALEVSFVVAIRNPLSVARSRAALDALRGRQEKSDLEWLVNLVPFFRVVARHPFVVVDYDLLMLDPAGQLERMARALQLPLDARARVGIASYVESFLSPSMRHTTFSDLDLEREDRLHPLARDAYRLLRRLAEGGLPDDPEAFWRDWGRIEQALADLAPLLRLVDELEGRLRRRRTWWRP